MEGRFKIDLNSWSAAGRPHTAPDHRWAPLERARPVQPEVDYRCGIHASPLQHGTSGSVYSRWSPFLRTRNGFHLQHDDLPPRSQSYSLRLPPGSSLQRCCPRWRSGFCISSSARQLGAAHWRGISVEPEDGPSWWVWPLLGFPASEKSVRAKRLGSGRVAGLNRDSGL